MNLQRLRNSVKIGIEEYKVEHKKEPILLVCVKDDPEVAHNLEVMPLDKLFNVDYVAEAFLNSINDKPYWFKLVERLRVKSSNI